MYKRILPTLFSCIFLITFPLAGCASRPAPERGELCMDILAWKVGETGPSPTSWELAEYLRGLLKEGQAIPVTNLSEGEGPCTWLFFIDGIQYEYWSNEKDKFYLVSEEGNAYPIETDRLLTIVACITPNGQMYYDASFEGYLLGDRKGGGRGVLTYGAKA